MTIPIKRTQKEHDESYLKSSLWDELIDLIGEGGGEEPLEFQKL